MVHLPWARAHLRGAVRGPGEDMLSIANETLRISDLWRVWIVGGYPRYAFQPFM